MRSGGGFLRRVGAWVVLLGLLGESVVLLGGDVGRRYCVVFRARELADLFLVEADCRFAGTGFSRFL